MKALANPIALVTALAILGSSAVAAAQTPAERRGYVGFKAGINHEQAEDGLIGTSPAAGIAAGVSLSPAWSGEVEVWIPGYLRDVAGDPEHRDIQFSVSAVRAFHAGGSRPFLVAGISRARTETYLTTCIADRVPPAPLGITHAVPAAVDCSEPDVRERFRQRFNTASGYFLLGAGVEITLGRRLRLVPELRVHLAATSIVVRPAVGIVVGF
jgi:hypothetical protein